MLLFSEDTNRGGFGVPSRTSEHSQRAAPEIIRDLRTTTTAGELQPVDQLLLPLLTSLAYPRSALQSLSVRTHLVLRSKYPTLLMARTLQRSVNSAQSTVHDFNAFFSLHSLVRKIASHKNFPFFNSRSHLNKSKTLPLNQPVVGFSDARGSI